MTEALVIVAFLALMAWTYIVYQIGYENASKDAETIAGRKLWLRQEAIVRHRRSNIPPWEAK